MFYVDICGKIEVMEFKGTKGDWVIYTPNHSGATNVKFGNEERDGYVELWHHHSSINQAKANALLISKAPEMLEMLNDLHGRIDFSWEAWGSSEGIELSNKIEQLIKEATEL